MAAELGADFGWDEIEALVEEGAAATVKGGRPGAIVGILRGGIIPAVMLAHQLGLRDVRGVEITHTRTDGPGSPKTAQPQVRNCHSLGDLSGLDVVLVDDVAGTGDTLAVAARHLHEAGARQIRTLVCVVNVLNRRPGQPVEATYIGCEIKGWARFPWETR